MDGGSGTDLLHQLRKGNICWWLVLVRPVIECGLEDYLIKETAELRPYMPMQEFAHAFSDGADTNLPQSESTKQRMRLLNKCIKEIDQPKRRNKTSDDTSDFTCFGYCRECRWETDELQWVSALLVTNSDLELHSTVINGVQMV